MIDVAHHRYHGCSRQLDNILVSAVVNQVGVRIIKFCSERQVTHFLNQDHRGFLIEYLVDGNHRSHLHQRLDDFRSLDRHLVRQVRNRDGFRNMHFAYDRLDRLLRH